MKLEREKQTKIIHHLKELFKLSGFSHETISEKIDVIIQNEAKDKLYQVWLMVAEDKNGNESIISQPSIIMTLDGQPRIGGNIECSPYEYDLENMQNMIKRLQEILKDSGLKVKLKKFVSETV